MRFSCHFKKLLGVLDSKVRQCYPLCGWHVGVYKQYFLLQYSVVYLFRWKSYFDFVHIKKHPVFTLVKVLKITFVAALDIQLLISPGQIIKAKSESYIQEFLFTDSTEFCTLVICVQSFKTWKLHSKLNKHLFTVSVIDFVSTTWS